MEVNLSSAVSGNERDVVYVIFPTGGGIRKRGGEGKETLHALALLQFMVFLSARAGEAVPMTTRLFVCLSPAWLLEGFLRKE